jgi:hypothetical protein
MLPAGDAEEATVDPAAAAAEDASAAAVPASPPFAADGGAALPSAGKEPPLPVAG